MCRKGCGQGYHRTGWTNPRSGTRVAAIRDTLVARAVDSAEITGLFKSNAGFFSALKYLQDMCGYIVATWPSPNKGWQKPYKRYRITGRLDWRGGVAEDYTVPKVGREC